MCAEKPGKGSCVESRFAASDTPGSQSHKGHSRHVCATLTLLRNVSQRRAQTQVWRALMSEDIKDDEEDCRGWCHLFSFI